MNKLNRNMEQYLEIEEFEDYEFTSCIAYEMAIRNDRVIKLIKENIFYEKENKHFNSDIDDELLTKFYIDEYFLNYHFFSEIFNISDVIISMGWRWGNDYKNNRLEKDEKRIFSIEHFKGFSSTSIVNEIDGIVPEQSYLLTNFKRPPLESFPIIKELDVRLNFSLPEKDLVEYIKHIKKEFDKKNSIIKSGFELLNDIEFNNSDKINLRDILAYKERVADMFFIYDSMKLSHKILKIRYILEDYYSSKGVSTKSFTEKTIRKYFELAKEYIDNCKYKELITGIRQSDLTKAESSNFKI